jgi:uncharacterized protein
MMRLDTERLVIDMKSLLPGTNSGKFEIPIDRIDWDIEDIQPEGSQGTLELNIYSGSRTIQCTGKLDALFRTPCARCLEPALFSVTEPVDREYAWDPEYQDDENIEIIPETGELDILDAVREAVVLSIPGKPLCSPDCTGICYN